MNRCTYCRSEIDDCEDDVPVCVDCKAKPETTLDRDALDRQYQAGLERVQRRGVIQ